MVPFSRQLETQMPEDARKIWGLQAENLGKPIDKEISLLYNPRAL